MLMLQKSFVSMGFFKPWLTKRIKRTNKWLNNANPWILSSSRCNHDVKFITASGKDNKSLITSQKYQFTQRTCIFLLQIVVKKIITINKDTNSYDVINKSHHLIIQCLNTSGSQQEISSTKAISYLLNLLDHLINYNFTFIPWYNLSSWVNKHEIKEVNKKKDHGDTFETFTIDKKLKKFKIHNS
jgi:hypothetical protein